MRISRIISSLAFCLYIAAVAYLCFASPDHIPELPQLWFGLPSDKVGHFLMFLPYPILAYQTFASKDMSPSRCSLILLIIMITGVGTAFGTEQLQAALAYRSAEIHDLYADTAGMLTGGLCVTGHILLKNR